MIYFRVEELCLPSEPHNRKEILLQAGRRAVFGMYEELTGEKAAFSLRSDRNGRPYFADGSGAPLPFLDFNRSHTAYCDVGFLATAMEILPQDTAADLQEASYAKGRARVGIDIECPREVLGGDRCRKLAKRYFSRKEQEEAERDFYEVWTRKEAYLKYLGIGIGCRMAEIDTYREDLGVTFLTVSLPKPYQAVRLTVCGKAGAEFQRI